MKICTKCEIEKGLDQFGADNRVNGGLQRNCKDCLREYRHKDKGKKKEYDKRYFENNKEKIAPKKKKYADSRKVEKSEYDKKYREKNKDRDKIYRKKYAKEHRKEISEYQRNRRETDLEFKIAGNLRTRLNQAIKNNQKAGSAVKDLGCSIQELKEYLDSLFQPGMTWENWGLNGYSWHIDHIIPLSHFDLTNREQLLKACHYTNLQPLWAIENIKKGNKI